MLVPSIYPVTCHTDHVGQGSTFVAINGFSVKGTDYISTALKKGATIIVIDTTSFTVDIENECRSYGATLLTVQDTRKELAIRSAQALGNPASKLKIIGITGTKGKTTTTYLIESLLREAGHKTALIGTIKNRILDTEVDSQRTTPNSDYLNMFFYACVQAGVEFVVMEVSSHALSLDRVYGVPFAAAGFTNLAPEHMDFYATLEDYFAAKTKLFDLVSQQGTIVINLDNEWGQKAHALCLAAPKNILTFSLHNQSLNEYRRQDHYIVDVLKNSRDGLQCLLNNTVPERGAIKLDIPGMFGLFNVYNITMAFLICRALGISVDVLKKTLANFQGVPGRLQHHVLKNGAHAFVDYAHNPSSFYEVLSTLRPICKHLIVVFGCGGDRDTTKRPVMGKMAAEFADIVIITDDNPRTESREKIIEEILNGIPKISNSRVICELDRHRAIKHAAELSMKESIIALLGKGHEHYYIIGDQILHFDDMEEIKKY